MFILTPIDVFLESRPEWRWAFGQEFRGLNESEQVDYVSGVISTHRMDNWPIRFLFNEVRFNERVRKMLNKYIAIQYYGLSFSDDSRSAAYRSIGGIGDLDRIEGHIPVAGR